MEDLRWRYLGASFEMIVNVLNKRGCHVNEVKIAIFAITGKTNVAVELKIIDFQQTWGSNLGRLHRYKFKPSLKKIFLIYQQLLAKDVLNKEGCYINNLILSKTDCQNTFAEGAHYTKGCKAFY